MSIIEELSKLKTTKSNIRNAIINKGVPVPVNAPFSSYSSKINSIESGSGSSSPKLFEDGNGWSRPDDRPPLAFDIDEGPEDNTFYFLFGVKPDVINDMALRFTSEGTITIDWGDGVIETYDSNTTMMHIYEYSSIDVLANNDEQIKWVWIKVTSPKLTIFSGSVRHSLRPTISSANMFLPHIYEVYFKATELTQWFHSNTMYTFYRFLSIVKGYGTNKITSFAYFLNGCTNLKYLDVNTSKGQDFTAFLKNCLGFNQSLDFLDTSNATVLSQFLINSSNFNKPININSSKVINFSNFLSSCTNYSYPLNNIDTSKSINLSGMISSCNMIPQITISLKAYNASSINFATALHNLSKIRLLDMNSAVTTISIAETILDTNALIELFNDLYDRSELASGKITITNVYGASQLTPEQRAITTNKNWTIVG